mmetsp:Transcript_51090/g.158274  ORF Transcript_51090/g.158274 Transcript_51090/m.158274 type:complete len:472 (-) Transcript_51090:118-1533(-)
MLPPRPTQPEQYAPNNFVPAFQGEDIFSPAKFDDDERDEPRIMCGMLTPQPAGFVISFLIACEGCFVLANLIGTQSGASSLLPGLHQKNPYRDVQLVLLEIVGIANLVACLAIMLGLWLSRKPMPKLLRKTLDISQVRIVGSALGFALIYRALLVVVVAPWFGFMMAFEDRRSSGLRLFLMVAYIAYSAYVLATLFQIVLNAVAECWKLQERLTRQDREERRNLIGQAYSVGWPCPTEPPPLISEATPTLFVCFPLEPMVIFYTGLMVLFCIVWFIHLFLTGGGGGGWAFFTRLPRVHSTLGLEFFVNVVTVLFSLLALSALLFKRQTVEQSDAPWRTRKRTIVTLLLYFIVSVMRFAFFFPITGMAIAAKDVCGLYTHSIQDLAVSTYVVPPLHCTGGDVWAVASVLVTFCLDAYFIWGVLKLWQISRAEFVVAGAEEAAQKALDKYPSMAGWGTAPKRGYGSAGLRPVR